MPATSAPPVRRIPRPDLGPGVTVYVRGDRAVRIDHLLNYPDCGWGWWARELLEGAQAARSPSLWLEDIGVFRTKRDALEAGGMT